MRIKRYRSRLAAALVGVAVWLATISGGEGRVLVAPRVAAAATEETACSSRADEAWLVMQRKQAREDRVQHLREQEQQRGERQQLQEYRAGAHRDMARRNVAARQIADLVPEEYRLLVLEVAERFDVDPRLVGAVGAVESRWYRWAEGTLGDAGLMQILPSTGRWIAGRLGYTDYDLYDPETNVIMGTWYLRILYNEYGSWEKALAAYNGGPRAAARGADFPYTRRVLSVYHSNGRGT